jgi:hypothetical protein
MFFSRFCPVKNDKLRVQYFFLVVENYRGKNLNLTDIKNAQCVLSEYTNFLINRPSLGKNYFIVMNSSSYLSASVVDSEPDPHGSALSLLGWKRQVL